MFIEIPDEHPGRCRNQRVVWVNGYPENLRCVDYDAIGHVCEFPTPRNLGFGARPLVVPYTAGDTKSKAWVRP